MILKIKEVGSFSVYPGKKNPNLEFRTTNFVLEDGRKAQTTTLSKDSIPVIGQEYSSDNYTFTEEEYKGEKYIKIAKIKENFKPYQEYQKEPINTRACLINNVLPACVLEILHNQITFENFVNLINKAVNLINNEINKTDVSEDNKTSQETPSCETKKEPLTPKQKAILVTLKKCTDDEDELRFYLEAITGIGKFHDLDNSSCGIFFDYIKEIVGDKETLNTNDIDLIKIELKKLEK